MTWKKKKKKEEEVWVFVCVCLLNMSLLKCKTTSGFTIPRPYERLKGYGFIWVPHLPFFYLYSLSRNVFRDFIIPRGDKRNFPESLINDRDGFNRA